MRTVSCCIAILLMKICLICFGYPTQTKTYIEIFSNPNDVSVYLANAWRTCRESDDRLHLPMVNTSAKILLYKTLEADFPGIITNRNFEFWTNATSKGGDYFWDDYPLCTAVPTDSNLWAGTTGSSTTRSVFKVESPTVYGLYQETGATPRGIVVCEMETDDCDFNEQSTGTCPNSSTQSSSTLNSGIDGDIDCQNLCSNFVSGETECWAYLYSNISQECILFYHTNPLLFTYVETVDPCPGSYPNDIKLVFKECYHVNYNSAAVETFSFLRPAEISCSSAQTFVTTTTSTTSTTSTSTSTTSTTTPSTSSTTSSTSTSTTSTTSTPTTSTTSTPTTSTMSTPTSSTTSTPPTSTTSTPTTSTTSTPTTSTTSTSLTSATSTTSTTYKPTTSTTSTLITSTTPTTNTTSTSSITITSTSISSSTIESTMLNTLTVNPKRLFLRPCLCSPYANNNLTVIERAEQYVKELTIDSSKTSAAIRSKTSAQDERTSSITIGSVSILVFALPVFLIFIVDGLRVYTYLTT